MRPIVCDICNGVEQTGYNYDGVSLHYNIKLNGQFYPEDFCQSCGETLRLTALQLKNNIENKRRIEQEQAKRSVLDKERMTREQAQEYIEEKKKELDNEDNNPATQ